MRDGWVETILVDAVEVLDRFRKPINSTEREGRQGSVPYYGANGQAGWINDSIFNEELVLLGEDAIDFADPNARKAYLISGPSWVNNHAHVLRAKPEKVYSYFLAESLNKVDYSQYVSFGTRSKLTQGSMNGIKVLLPPLPEQKRIVDLVSSVDSYIEALQQQLESAKRSRNAVLHELLTTGGDDWVETTLGEVALLNPSEPALSDTAHFAPMDAVHVGKRWLQYTEERRDRNGARARAGDVLFARITPCLENGKIAQVQSEFERCGGSTEFIVVRGTEKCTSDFLYFWCTLKVNRDKAAELMTGTTGRQRLSWQGLGSLRLWLPSITEQERIVSSISEFDSLIESTESAITESKNLRSGLLSDLLSGEHEIPASYDKVIGAA